MIISGIYFGNNLNLLGCCCFLATVGSDRVIRASAAHSGGFTPRCDGMHARAAPTYRDGHVARD